MGGTGCVVGYFKEFIMMNTTAGKEKLFVIKIGGNVIDDPKKSDSFLKEFSSIGSKKILVHGGGKIATALGNQLNIPSKYIDGRRITDDETIDLVTMVYGGLVNKKMVVRLQSFGCNAIGITGADSNILPAKKRPVGTVDYGWVGDIYKDDVNSKVLKLFIENGLIPVVAPLTHDGNGHVQNTNADTIASVIATNLSGFYRVILIFCFERNGVLLDINNEASVVKELNHEKYLGLKNSNQIFAGILPKIDNAFDAINNGVDKVLIGNSSDLTELINGNRGTKILLL
jgi:acetylglutamate kinase